MKHLLVCLLALTLSTVPAPVLASHSPLAAAEELGVQNGAQYAMFLPATWNGRLVLYAHGFIDPADPIALPDVAPADIAPWVVSLRETLLAAGYAVAYSSYAENGWAVQDGAARTHELRETFMARFGVPTRVYIMGRSLGALITVMLAEAFPGSYQGALALCGPVGSARTETDYIGNVRVLFDYFYPGVIPGDVLNVPEMEYSADSEVVQAIINAMVNDLPSAVELASIDQVQVPYTTVGQLINSVVRALGYNIRGTNDILARTGGQSPFGNRSTTYTGVGTVLRPGLNTATGRFDAQAGGLSFLDDFYRPRGNLSVPLLTLHTVRDPDVPFFHEAALARTVSAAGRSRWLAQHSVQRYGHCNFSPAEVGRTLSRLVNWAERNVKPANGDVTADFTLAFPVDNTRSTVAATLSEFTGTVNAALAAAGFPPLPTLPPLPLPLPPLPPVLPPVPPLPLPKLPPILP